MIGKGTEMGERHFIYHEDSKIRELAVDIYTSRYEISKVWKRKDTYIELPGENLGMEVPKSLLAYKSKIILMAREEKAKELELCSKKGEADNIMDLQKQIMNLDKVKKHLSKALGERIILSFNTVYRDRKSVV